MIMAGEIPPQDRLPLWRLVKCADIPFRRMVPIIQRLDLPLWADETGTLCTSRSAFGALLVEVAEVDEAEVVTRW